MMYFGLEIDDELRLVIPEYSMAEEVFNLVDSDREHLGAFLDFVETSVDASSQRDYFKMKMLGVANETDKLFFITLDDRIVGCIDLHNINMNVKKAEVGYWLHSAFTGRNIMSRAVEALRDYSFTILGLNKLSILADVDNTASNKVALKSGFLLVGVKHQDEIRNGEFRDMNEYELLKSDVEEKLRASL